MSKIDLLEQKIRKLYEAKDPGRAEDWADWLYAHHVFVVADYAGEVAKKMGGDVELSRAAGMLHDIADVHLMRSDPTHEAESLEIARKLMLEAGYSDGDIETVVNDALKLHSCHDGERPKTLEGKALATADAMAHLKTDFYLWAVRSLTAVRSLPSEAAFEQAKAWTRKRLSRDYHEKIQFEEVRAGVKQDYELLTELFSR